MKIKPLDPSLISFAQSNEVVVLATYNDLLLFWRRRSATWANSCYYICNPFTKQWVFIPPPPPGRPQPIATEGFSLDLNNKCCKVVRILEYSVDNGTSHRLLMVEIFSFETGKWIESDLVLQGTKPDHDESYFKYFDGQSSPVAHNGTLYWMTWFGAHLIGLELFRSTNCRAHFIYNPNYLLRSYVHRGSTLGVFQGSVRLCQLYAEPASTVCLYISELKEDDDDGIRKLCLKELVDLQPCIRSLPALRDHHHLLAFDPKDEDIVYLWRGDDYSSNTAAIRSCNIRKLTISHISNNSSWPSSNYLQFESFSFVLPRWRWPTPVPQLN